MRSLPASPSSPSATACASLPTNGSRTCRSPCSNARRDPEAADRGAQLLILDEPTSVLTPPELEELRVPALAGDGGPLRDLHHAQARGAARCGQSLHRAAHGRVVGTIEGATTTDTATLARMMVGRDRRSRVERPAVDSRARAVLGVESSPLAHAREGLAPVVPDPRVRSSAWPASTATARANSSTPHRHAPTVPAT